MFLRIETLGEHGIITDLSPSQLPPNAWSSGQNIRFNDGKVFKFSGHESFITPAADWDGGGITNTTDRVYYLLPVAEGSEYYWIYCGLNDVQVYTSSSGAKTEITNTGGDYTATDSTVDWTGCIIGGIPVLNNGVDTPQMWATVSPGTPLTDLTGFSTQADKCGALRAYKNYLIAMDVTKSGTRYPSLVKWSDSSALGTVPASWDETDATTDAGENELAGTRTDVNVGVALDGMTMRDSFIIYKDDSIWSMNFVGGTFVFEFRKIYSAQGMLARKCVGEFEGKHFVVGQSDVFVHDGANFTSVIDPKRQKALFTDISPEYYDRTFVYANYSENEMWVCYVSNLSADIWPNKAYIWNWRHNTWGIRELPSNTPFIEGGIADTREITDIWTQDDGTWADWTVEWGDLGFNPSSASTVIATEGEIYKADSTGQFAGTPMTSIAERRGIPIGEQDEFVRIKAAYPRMDGNTVQVDIGAQKAPDGPVQWNGLKDFTPNIDQKIDVRVTGTHAAIKIQTDCDCEWGASGIDLEFEPISRR